MNDEAVECANFIASQSLLLTCQRGAVPWKVGQVAVFELEADRAGKQSDFGIDKVEKVISEYGNLGVAGAKAWNEEPKNAAKLVYVLMVSAPANRLLTASLARDIHIRFWNEWLSSFEEPNPQEWNYSMDSLVRVFDYIKRWANE